MRKAHLEAAAAVFIVVACSGGIAEVWHDVIAAEGEWLALSLDPLMTAKVGGAPGFVGFAGMLDRAGTANEAISLPNVPELRDLALHTAYIVFDPRQPMPLLGVSETLRLVVQ